LAQEPPPDAEHTHDPIEYDDSFKNVIGNYSPNVAHPTCPNDYAHEEEHDDHGAHGIRLGLNGGGQPCFVTNEILGQEVHDD
jgi:hypothetical protein